MSKETAERFQFYFWRGRALFLGPGVDTQPHQHHAIQLVIGLNGTLRLRGDATNQWQTADGFLIASNQLHQLDCGANRVACVYLDPQSKQARNFAACTPLTPLRSVSVQHLRPVIAQLQTLSTGQAEALNCSVANQITSALLASLELPNHSSFGSSGSTAIVADQRIQQLLTVLRSQPHARPSAAELAAQLNLSIDRFLHLFRAQTGLPFRRYLLWLRLLSSVQAAANGATLTTSAHQSEFADAAHLSRTFKRMFGLSPSKIFRGSQFVQAYFCGDE